MTWSRLSGKEIEMMKESRRKGLSYKKIGDLFGLSGPVVCYYLDEEFRKKRRAYATRYHKANAKKVNASSKKWRQKNPDRNLRHVCFGVIRFNLKRGTVTPKELHKCIDKWEDEN